MSQKIATRSGKDRLRYTLSFEITLMIFLIPAGALFFDKGFTEIGILGLALSIKAMIVNFIYNWAFDQIDARAGRVSSDRKTLGRILHASGFEITLLITSMPIYMWWLSLSLTQAFLTDLVVTSFVVLYTYFFTLGYDRLFPVIQPQRPIKE
jgi:uncharacterized membrane protein